MEQETMSKNKDKLPEIIVFDGPNGSGKTTITHMVQTIGTYINVDDIKKSNSCTDLEAAVKAEKLRESMKEKKNKNLRKCPKYCPKAKPKI